MDPSESTEQAIEEAHRFRVLVADDEPLVQRLYQTVLSRNPNGFSAEIEQLINSSGLGTSISENRNTPLFDVTIVDQGEKAVTAAKEAFEEGNPFTVAFLDIRMPPGIDGVETARQLLEIDERIYIVFVTAFADHSMEEINQSTCNSSLLLRKPFFKEEIHQLAITLSNNWLKDRKQEDMVSRAELEALNNSIETKNEFFATMSHEFRTPLTTIIGNSELLIDQEEHEDKLNLLHSIAAAGHSQLSLVNDILDLSKIEHGNFSISIKPYDLHQLIDNIKFIFTEHARSAGLFLQVNQLVEPKFKLSGDMQRISQILINLIGNAIKFTESGGIILTVWNSGAHLHFSIKDTGIGIPENKLEDIFKLFEQAHTDREHRASSGLGLYISMTLAQLMGGDIEVTSEPDKGSTFELILPYQESNIEANMNHHFSNEHQTQLEGTVLVVDDRPSLRSLERRILESMGMIVVTARNGQEAITLATNNPTFDVILMDLRMPVMDGIEAATELRNHHNQTPIILMSADHSNHYADLIEVGTINSFIEKPIHRVELYTTLSKFLQDKESTIKASAATPVAAEIGSNEEYLQLMDDEIRDALREELMESQQTISRAFKQQDWKQLRETAHVLKGSGTSFGHPEISKLGKEICEAIDNNEHKGLTRMIIQMAGEIRNALQEL